MPSESSGSPLSQDDAFNLHRRLLDADPTAPADLAQTYLDWLAQVMRTRHHDVDEHLCDTAAADALIALIKNPQSYDPARASLAAYLKMSAAGDLRNALEKERRQHLRNVPLESVELSRFERNFLVKEDSDPAEHVTQHETDVRLPDVPLSTRRSGTGCKAWRRARRSCRSHTWRGHYWWQSIQRRRNCG